MVRAVVREANEIRAILEVACLNREHLTILARDGRFEADFIHLDDRSLHLAGDLGLARHCHYQHPAGFFFQRLVRGLLAESQAS
jgi:hypothetical protein